MRSMSGSKVMICGILAAAMMAAMGFGAAAAESGTTKISSVELSFTSWVSQGQDSLSVDINPLKAGYLVDGYEVLNQPAEGWSNYDCPRIEITLYSDDDYVFKSKSSGYFKLKGDVFQFVDAERSDENTTMTLIVDLKPGAAFSKPLEPDWGNNGTAKWGKAYKGSKYNVELYKDETRIASETTAKLNVDFSEEMKEEGNYWFKVRTVSTNGEYSSWVESDTYNPTTASTSGQGGAEGNTASKGPGSNDGVWQQNAGGWWYKNTDGTWPSNAWRQIGGLWYYFDESGYMVTGLRNIGDSWYFLGEQGDMKTGWIEDDGKFRYFDPATGAMLVNSSTPDGFTVGADGLRQ